MRISRVCTFVSDTMHSHQRQCQIGCIDGELRRRVAPGECHVIGKILGKGNLHSVDRCSGKAIVGLRGGELNRFGILQVVDTRYIFWCVEHETLRLLHHHLFIFLARPEETEQGQQYYDIICFFHRFFF